MSSSPPPNSPPKDRFLKPTLPLRAQINAVASSSTSTAIASSSQSAWPQSQDVEEDSGVAMYRRQEVPPSQYLASQPTQIADMAQEEVPEHTVVACLRGRNTTLDVDLYDDRSSYLFGTSTECDVIIPHSHWRLTSRKEKEPWFKLHITPRKNSPGIIIVYIESIRAKGVSVQGKPLLPGTRRHLRYGEVVTGGQDEGNELFGYTFRSTDKRNEVQGEHAKYSIENKPVASGMYSRVYRATYGDNEECECACKHINVLSREMTKEERENIAHEISLLKSMHHENIVHFIDVAQIEYEYYIFTEMIHGTTLHDHYIYQRNIFTELETRNIFQQICEAVNYLHQRGIVHRDIKSENVMVTDDCKIKLIDFGLARTTSSNEVLSNRCGTRAYMAPEADQSEESSNGYGKAVGWLEYTLSKKRIRQIVVGRNANTRSLQALHDTKRVEVRLDANDRRGAGKVRRRNSQADIRVGSHRGVSQMHCKIYKKQDDLPEDSHLPVEQRRKKEVIMMADGSHNGTYVNLMKVDHGMACQVVDGDVLGLVVPCSRDYDNLQENWFNEPLKYQVTLYSKMPEIFNPAKRRYETCEDVPEKNKTRVMESRDRGTQWGELVDEDDPTKKYALAGLQVSIGRDRNCVIEWDGLYPYIENRSAKNDTWVSNQRVIGRVQLRNNDVIMLAREKGDSKKAAYTIKFQRSRRE
ncbi:calcium calmodulin-dependent protein kinase type 1G [Podila clonocystis]|nr:calcium calmodulin-dependent protein kinase type 1G [Podila clonocystis]